MSVHRLPAVSPATSTLDHLSEAADALDRLIREDVQALLDHRREWPTLNGRRTIRASDELTRLIDRLTNRRDSLLLMEQR